MLSSRPEQVDKIDNLFQQLNWRGRHHFGRRLERFGLTVPQYLALHMIRRIGPDATMSEVSDALHLPRSSMTSIADRLVEDGLIQRGALASDRRAVSASITPTGAELVAAVEAAGKADLTSILEGLSYEDLAHFVRVLTWLLDGIDRLSETVALTESTTGGRG